MASHTVLIGYGDTGRTPADMLSIDQATSELVVVDTDRPINSTATIVTLTGEPGLHDVAEHLGADHGPLVLAVVRGGTRVWRDDPAVTCLRPGDRLLVLRASTVDD